MVTVTGPPRWCTLSCSHVDAAEAAAAMTHDRRGKELVANAQTVQSSAARGQQRHEARTAAPAELPAPAAERRAPRQLAITIVAEIKRRRLSALKRTLEAMGADPAANDVVPF